MNGPLVLLLALGLVIAVGVGVNELWRVRRDGRAVPVRPSGGWRMFVAPLGADGKVAVPWEEIAGVTGITVRSGSDTTVSTPGHSSTA